MLKPFLGQGLSPPSLGRRRVLDHHDFGELGVLCDFKLYLCEYSTLSSDPHAHIDDFLASIGKRGFASDSELWPDNTDLQPSFGSLVLLILYVYFIKNKFHRIL